MEYSGSGTMVSTLNDTERLDCLSGKTIFRITGRASFYRNGKLYRAALYSLFRYGAHFISRSIDVRNITEGRAGEYYLRTAYGHSKCRGVTRKIVHHHPVIIWEVEFIELSENDEDPINKVLNDISQ